MPRPTSAVWEHFLTLNDSGGKRHVVCCFCSTQYKYAMANKLRLHILSCKKCPKEVKMKFKPEAKASTSQSPQGLTVSTPPAAATVSLTSSEQQANSPQSCHENISSSVHPTSSDHDDINIALARAIYASGVPLSLLESEQWKHVFHLFDPTYEVPTRHTLSNKLLDTEYSRIKEDITVKINHSLALALIVDGWTNINGKGVINFIVTTPEPIFYHAIYPETNRETGEFIGSQIIRIINEIGPAKFILVVTDNARNMKAAWRIIKSEFPHISCVGCVSHTLNLIYKDVINEIDVFKTTLDKIIQVIKYIKQTHVVLAAFEKYQIEKYGNTDCTCTLKLFCRTRWSGAYITMGSYLKNREALELLAISHEVTITQEIKCIILDTDIWVKLDEIVNILQPLAIAILSSERDKCLLSDVYYTFENLKKGLTQLLDESVFLNSEEKNLLLGHVSRRKDFCMQSIHFAAYLLDPRHCGKELSDEDVSKATEYIKEYCVTSGLDVTNVLTNMAEFKTKTIFFQESKSIWSPTKKLEPRIWWQTFALNQSVGNIATKILSVPPSSAASERNWSMFAHTHTKLRNRLKQPRVLKLISIRSNLNLLKKQDENILYNNSEDEDSEDGEIEHMSTSNTDPLV